MANAFQFCCCFFSENNCSDLDFCSAMLMERKKNKGHAWWLQISAFIKTEITTLRKRPHTWCRGGLDEPCLAH